MQTTKANSLWMISALVILALGLYSPPVAASDAQPIVAPPVETIPSPGHESMKPLLWRPVVDGIERSSLRVDDDSSPFRLLAFRVDLTRFRLIAADARQFGPERKTADLREMARWWKGLLAVNGSYFDENDRPLGLVVSNGVTLNSFRKADWGVLYEVDGRAGLVHTRDWPKRSETLDPDFAIQVGPRVVVNGEPTRLKPQIHRRAAIGILPGGRSLVLVVTDSGKAEANALARVMATSPEKGGLGCRDAVMMDGGPSAQLYLNAGGQNLSVPGGWSVPVGVLVVERNAAPNTQDRAIPADHSSSSRQEAHP